MVAPLLSTKLYIPPVRPERVTRPRLIERLNMGSSGKLILVSAPAGFGRTTLVSEWVNLRMDESTNGRSVAWLSLDEDDNDPTRFLSYLIAALQTIHADIAKDSLALFRTPHALPPASTDAPRSKARRVKSVMTTLINEIATAPGDLTLVLDDYHVIEHALIHEAMTFLLDHLPPHTHIVITCRADPPLPLSRLRARGKLIELRSTDLRFTLDEAATFLNQVMRLQLSAGDVSTLETRTEGWIAGLQLAGLALQRAASMQDREGAQNFVAAFAGSHRYILDYLTDEVFYHQPEPLQAFLLQTSILDRLTGKLCDAVAGRDDSSTKLTASGQATLEMLEQSNLFVVPLDGERRWYRYHHLFSDLLRYRLDKVMPGQTAELHRRACEWYAQSGRVYEAMGHALAAGDFERATRLVEETDPATMVMRGEVATLLNWLNGLPDEIVRSQPRLSLSYAWAFYVTNNMDGIGPRLQDALRALGIDDDDEDEANWPTAPSAQVGEFLREVSILRACVALYRGDAHRTIELAQQAINRLPENSLLRVAATAVMGDAYLQIDNVAAASRSYGKAIASSQAAGHGLLTMLMTKDLAWSQVTQGKLYQAAQAFGQVLQWGSGRRRPLYPVGQAHIGLGDLLREWNDLDAAERHLREGIAQCEMGGYARYLPYAYTALAWSRQARGDAEGMMALIQKAEQFAEKIGAAGDIAYTSAQRARLWLTPTGRNLAAAVHWRQTCGLSAEGQPGYSNEVEYLTLARVLIAEGERKRSRSTLSLAQSLLTRLLQAAESSGRMGSVIEALALLALVLQASGETAQAMVALERALALAMPEGYVRLFVDMGAPLAELLRRAASRNIFADYVIKLLAVFQDVREPGASLAHALADPLAKRELDVLRLLAAGLSYREIATELFIALGTVKTHTRNIYSKLDVGSRTRALARAREWNLLP